MRLHVQAGSVPFVQDSFRALVASALLAVAVAPLAAQAQQAPVNPNAGEQLQEIIVTAQRHETLLKDTPASIEAFTADRLDAQGIRGVDDLARLTPGVTFARTGVTSTGNYNDENADVAVRGIDSSAGASTTGIYIDDTPIMARHLAFGTLNAFPALFDVDRVEVLRGPQGTLFGAGSEGGAVRFLQPAPSADTKSGYYRSEVGVTKNGDPSYEAGAAYGAPIVPGKIGMRISASFRRDGGYVDRVSYDPTSQTPTSITATGTTASNTNSQNTATARIALKFQLTPDTAITPSIFYQRLQLNDTSAYWTALSNPDAGVFRSGNLQPNTSTDPFTLYAVKVESNLGWATLTSNTSYFYRDQAATTDYTQFLRAIYTGSSFHTAGALGTATFTDKQENVVEEVRLQSADPKAQLTWQAGLFLTHARENTKEYIYDTQAVTVFGFTGVYPNNGIYVQDPFLAIDKQVALFGQADYKLTESVKLTAGLRVASINSAGNEYYAGPFVGPLPGTASGSFTEHPVTPMVMAEWHADADNMLYAKAAKGYRVGGINAGLGTLCAADLATFGLSSTPGKYQSDSLWSYEFGAKDTLLDHRLQVDSSAFYIDWSNIQQNVYLPTCGLQFAANLGHAVSKGFDVSVRGKLTADLMLSVEAGYTNARYTRTVYAGSSTGPGYSVVSSGDLLDPTPWNLNFSGEYRIPGFGNVDPYVHADYQVTSGQAGNLPAQNTNNASYFAGTANQLASRNLTMRGGARWDEFDVSMYANNLLNSAPRLIHSHDTAGSTLYFDRTWRPRTIGFTGTYRF